MRDASDKLENFRQAFGTGLHEMHDLVGFLQAAHMGLTMVSERIDQQGWDKTKIIFFGRGDPSAVGATFSHSILIGELHSRTAKDGADHLQLMYAVIVRLYAIWEDLIRPPFETVIGSPISSDFFGDLRQLRRHIVHARGVVPASVAARLKVQVRLIENTLRPTFEETEGLFEKFVDELKKLHLVHLGVDLPLSYRRTLSAQNASTRPSSPP